VKGKYKWTVWIGSIILVLVISISIGAYVFLRSTTPDYTSDTIVTGLSAEVEIVRDSYGMPHIYAASDNDAFCALGYCTAQDRLFQMEMIRRSVTGRLAEIIGPEVVDIDRLFRTITSPHTISDMYAPLPDDVKEAMTAYATGVNSYLNDSQTVLPFEFSLLGVKPEPWRPEECLTVLYYMAWALNFSFDTEILHQAVAEKVGPELAAELFIDYPADGPTIVQDGEMRASVKELLRAISLARTFTGTPIPGCSNNWVVSGERSVTGKPILANDMHLGLALPSIWYEAHLATPTMNVSGVVLPGAPLVVAGANEHVAWGFTNVMADDADYYIEEVNPADSTQYKFNGQWESFIKRIDSINVRGNEPVELSLRYTRHGVIIDDVIPIRDSMLPPPSPLAMKWTMYDFDQEAAAIFRLNHAGNINDIEAAAALYKCPGQNWVYADDQGNIGFWAAVGIPIRRGFTGAVPLPGWDGKHEWDGYVATGDQPHLKNPKRGYIATANNKEAGDNYPYIISNYYAPPDRITRIERMLEEKEKLSVDDFKRMQSDDYLVAAEVFVPRLLEILDPDSLNDREIDALEELQTWNYHCTTESIATTIYHATLQCIIERLFKDRMGEDLYKYYIAESVFTLNNALRNLFSLPSSQWFDDPATDEKETADDVLTGAYTDAITFLSDSLGQNMDDWRWGRVHTLSFYNPLGDNIPILGRFMKVEPFAVGGSSNCIDAMLYRFSAPWRVVAGPSQRHIFDLANIDRSLRIIPTGISGNFMSPHYADQVDLWKNGNYRPFVLNREIVDRDKAYEMKLIPVSDDNIELAD